VDKKKQKPQACSFVLPTVGGERLFPVSRRGWVEATRTAERLKGGQLFMLCPTGQIELVTFRQGLGERYGHWTPNSINQSQDSDYNHRVIAGVRKRKRPAKRKRTR